MAVQAVPPSVDAAAQAGGLPPRPKAVQYEPVGMAPALVAEAVKGLVGTRFLERAVQQ